jgi:hypothetical protein
VESNDSESEGQAVALSWLKHAGGASFRVSNQDIRFYGYLRMSPPAVRYDAARKMQRCQMIRCECEEDGSGDPSPRKEGLGMEEVAAL